MYRVCVFLFNDTAATEIYTLSLHDALPIYVPPVLLSPDGTSTLLETPPDLMLGVDPDAHRRSEEHTSELQSRQYLVCRLLLEKKKSPHCHSYYILLKSQSQDASISPPVTRL